MPPGGEILHENNNQLQLLLQSKVWAKTGGELCLPKDQV